MDKPKFLLFFRASDDTGVKFLEPERLDPWIQRFGENNFIGGICCKKLDYCYDVVGIILEFLDPYIYHTKYCRLIRGPEEKLEEFLVARLGGVFTEYKGEGPEEWLSRARQNMVKEGIAT